MSANDSLGEFGSTTFPTPALRIPELLRDDLLSLATWLPCPCSSPSRMRGVLLGPHRTAPVYPYLSHMPHPLDHTVLICCHPCNAPRRPAVPSPR